MTTPSDPTQLSSDELPAEIILDSLALVYVDPFLSAAARGRIFGLFTDLDRTQPTITRRFLAGLICDQAVTLPPNDPWRTVTVNNGPPLTDAAYWPDNTRFGSYGDFTDLLTVRTDRPDALPVDFDFAAIFDGVTDATSAIIATAFHDYPVLVDHVLNADHLQLDDLTEALRWLLVRRRCYDTVVDSWLWDSVAGWTWRAIQEHTDQRIRDDLWADERAADLAQWALDNQPPVR